MRLTAILIFCTLMQVSAAGFAQKFSYTKKNASLRELFSEITKQTGYDVLWSAEKLKASKPVHVDFKGTELEEVLKAILKDQPLTYSIEDKTVLIKEKTPSFLDRMADRIDAYLANVDARGKILDEQGKPLEGATVVLKGSSRTAKTDAKGEFSIPNVPDDGVLVIRYVGYKQLEIALKDAVMPLEIKLNVATGELEEVKVVYNTGYQELNKERATGSFVQIDKELFNRAVSTNVLDRILEVTNSLKLNNPTTPNAGISIRGFSTINANKRPLVVVDGFPYVEEKSFDSEIISLDQLNPNDVESVTILRDAAAASIWGARSGNGVIVITTKKGKYNQRPNISFSSNINLIEKPRLNQMSVISPMDAIAFEKKQFATGLYNQYDDLYAGLNIFYIPLSPAVEVMLAARKKNKTVPGYSAHNDPEVLARLLEMGQHDVRDDLSKYLLRTGVNQQYSFNIGGGSDKMKYYTSLGYDNNLPLDKGNKNNRLSLNFNSSYRPVKKIELSAYLVYTKSKTINNGVNNSQFLPGASSLVVPYSRLIDDHGNAIHVSRRGVGYRTAYIDTAIYPALLDWHYRPLDEINSNDNITNFHQIRSGGSISYEILDGLNVALNSQYIKTLSHNNNYQGLNSYTTRSLINQFMQRSANGTLVYPVPRGGILDYSNAEQASWNMRAQLSFNKAWKNHEINALGGAEASESRYSYSAAQSYGYDPSTATVFTSMDFSTAFPTRASGGSSQPIPNFRSIAGKLDRFTNYFANVGYTFANTYTFTASVRFDASNFFGSNTNQRVTPLWSSGIAWDITKERFYKLQWLPGLKLRATYGYNANLNNKATPLPTATYNPAGGGLPYHAEPYLRLGNAPNPGLTWEKIKMINVALDYSLFSQNRITGSIEYYTKKGINLIGSKIIEPTVGVASYTGNYANMLSKGFDLSLNTINLNGRLQWNTGVNFSYNIDKITEYEVSASELNSASIYVQGVSRIVGKPLSYLYSYPSAGLNPINGRPRGYVNGEIVDFIQVMSAISSGGAKPSDLVYHGSATPQMYGNVMNQFKYKNFILSFNVSYVLNYYLRRPSIDFSTLFNNWANAHGDYYLRWQKTGDENKTFVPALPDVLDSRDSFYRLSSDLVIKGDHIRLNDLRFSYDMNKSLFKQLPFNNVKFFAMASQLGIILWKANTQGINPLNPDKSKAPTSRAIAFGLNVNF